MNLIHENWRRYLEEDLLQEVTYKDAQKTMRDRGVKFIKAYNYDQGFDPKKNLGSLSTGLENRILSLIPSDIEDNQQGTSLLWVLRLLKDPKLKEIIMKTVVEPRIIIGHEYNAEFGNIRNNLETFFQFQRFMNPTDINKLKDADSLTNVVAGAKKAIEADKDKKLSADAPKGAEFFKGNFKFAEDGSVARDEEGLPMFEPAEDGWVIAAAHNKGAACLLGKKTNWCTAAPGLNYFNQYYNGEDDPLFFLMNPKGNRYQFAYGEKEFMDVDDNRMRGDDFHELDSKLKEALEAKDLEDRFSVVFEYEEVDYDKLVEEMLEKNIQRIDNNRIDISATAYHDYDREEPMIDGNFSVAYLFSMPPDYDGPTDLESESYDMIEQAFHKIMGDSLSLGGQEDSYGNATDATDVIYLEFGRSLLKVSMSGDTQGFGRGGLEEVDDFLYRSVNDLENNYEKVRNMLREVLMSDNILPKTKYDKMFFDIPEYDIDGDELYTDREDIKEKFEMSLDNIVVGIDEDEGTIEFGFHFPTPNSATYGKSPKNKELILTTANKRTIDSLNNQPELPGVDGGAAAQETLGMLTHIMNTNPQVEIKMNVSGENTYVDFVVNINDFDEAEIDQVVKSFNTIDKNIETYRKAMHDSFAKYIEKFPAEYPVTDTKELRESRRIRIIIERKSFSGGNKK
jgi:hypothetical protein